MGLTINVIRGRQPERLLFLMHGIGSDERDLPGLLPHLDPEGRFVAVFPRAPYSAPPGFAWFHFGDAELMAGTILSSLEAVEEALDKACADYGMRRAEAVVGGFSQGAVMALVLGLRRSEAERPAGILALSGYLPPEGRWTYDWERAPAVLLQHGLHDPLIPVSRAREAARTLASHGVPVVLRTYPMEHQVTLDSVRDAKAWLDAVRRGERPSEPVAEPPPGDELVRHITSAAQFEAEVLRSPKPVVVDFWAPWCQPCRAVDPVIRQMAAMRKGYAFVKVNIDELPEVAQRFGVQSIPMVALFRNGRLERASVGAKPRQQLEAELGMLVIP